MLGNEGESADGVHLNNVTELTLEVFASICFKGLCQPYFLIGSRGRDQELLPIFVGLLLNLLDLASVNLDSIFVEMLSQLGSRHAHALAIESCRPELAIGGSDIHDFVKQLRIVGISVLLVHP